MIALGVDAGGAAARWLLLDSSGRQLGGGELPAFTGLARTENLTRFKAVLSAARELAHADAVVAGVTGLHAGTAAAALFRAAATELGYGDAIWIGNDMRIAYASVFPSGGGVLVYTGTGSVAFHVRRDGTAVSAGGYGMLIDDAGAASGSGAKGLSRRCVGMMNLADRATCRSLRRSTDRSAAPIGRTSTKRSMRMAGAADRLSRSHRGARGLAGRHRGDRNPGAGGDLARLAKAVFGQLGAVLPVALAGGVVAAGSMLTDAFAANLPAGVPWRVASLEPARTAAELALANAVDSQKALSLYGT